MKSLAYYWYRQNFLSRLLLPLSWLFCAVAVIRRTLYRLGFLKSFSAGTPVVVIGNIVVGGSGKTPLLLFVCDYLVEKGFRPGVVSRGYGGNVTGLRQVQDNDTAELVGDEPLMIYQRTNVPVVVGADRVAAVNYLLENNQCDIVLSDDGLQHYRMRRDVEIAVVDAKRKFGNGYCLPAGPLREPVSRLHDVDMVVYNTTDSVTTEHCSYRLKIVDMYQLGTGDSKPLSAFTEKKVHAAAGIGDPYRFFAQLHDNGINTVEHAFPDHHQYKQDDFSGWSEDCIIMTEKDAVKCRLITLPDAWVVRVKADVTKTLESQLDSKVLPLVKQ